MTKIALLAASAVFLCVSASAGEVRSIADRCIAHVTKGQIRVYRDVGVLGSGRERIAYFRCVRGGLRDDAPFSAFAGLTPHVNLAFGGV